MTVSAGRRKVRAELRELVQAVIETARTIALDHPDITGLFSSPNVGKSDQSLVSVARAIADVAAPLVGLFVEYKMPATFVNDLRSKADSLEHYISLQTEGVGARAASGASVGETLRRFRKRGVCSKNP